MGSFAQIAIGRESWGANHNVARHRHDRAYVAVILSGGYEECGSRGRFCVGAGDVLLHDRFDAHLNRFQKKGAQILNLVVAAPATGFDIGHVDDPDAIARTAERCPADAGAALREQLAAETRAPEDWPDRLARDLLEIPQCRLDDWARKHGLAAETVSRGFGKVFGITPASFRLEARARRALRMIAGSDASLASIAAAGGFADQAHMTRAICALTGATPGAWRRSNPFKTAGVKAV